MDNNTVSTVSAFRIDGLHERQARAGRRVVSYEAQKRWLMMQRKFYTQFNRPETTQMIEAIIASVAKAEKFSRKR